MFGLFGNKKATGGKRLALISQRAKEIYAKKKGRKNRASWNNAQRQAVEELEKEGKI